MDSTTTPAPEAGDVAHAQEENQIAAPVEAPTEDETGQQEGADGGDESPEEAERKSRSKERRDRDKAAKARLHADLASAESAAAEKEARLRRIAEAHLQVAEPREADYPDPMEYVAARAVWHTFAQQRQAEQREAQQDLQQARAQADAVREQAKAALAAQWSDQVSEARSRYADFDDVVLRNQTVPVPQAVAQLIAASERGADVAYHICSRPDLAAEIAALPVVEAARRIGQIEARLSSPTKPRTETRAPPPINPVRTAASAPRVPDPDKDFTAWLRWRNGGGTY